MATGALVALTALADWYAGPTVSLGFFYILAMMLGATVSRPLEIVGLAVLCSILRSTFDVPSRALEVLLRFLFATLAYGISGLFVAALIRNRELVVEHLGRLRREQELRQDIEEQLKVLVESSPAAIFTTDSDGKVLASNRAAVTLFLGPGEGTLVGRRIGEYIPLLADALNFGGGPEGFRTAATCQGRRENGDIFLVHTWFSSYATSHGTRLAAIVVDSSEEMRDREEEGLRQLMRGNRIAAAAVSHEVRNLCSAISVLCSNLKEKHRIAGDEDFQGLTTLVAGLEKIASCALSGATEDVLIELRLQEVLDDLRIVIEPDWREIDGAVLWHLPPQIPSVLAERNGLLQAFLNLAQNSHRAVKECPVRELRIAVTEKNGTVCVRFQDTGPGVCDPEHLFQPFQPGADGTGLGLYVSRAVVRSYGGDLRFEPQASGTCFCVEIPAVD